MGSNIYKTPEDMAAWITEESGESVEAAAVRKAALEGDLINEEGKIGLYELLSFMAMFVQ